VDKVTISTRPNGPYLVKGPIQLLDPDGKAFPVSGDTVALCRCGQSANKPFCDGTHNKVGFQAAQKAGA
jgi:CDGSH-type Zn-finger protein